MNERKEGLAFMLKRNQLLFVKKRNLMNNQHVQKMHKLNLLLILFFNHCFVLLKKLEHSINVNKSLLFLFAIFKWIFIFWIILIMEPLSSKYKIFRRNSETFLYSTWKLFHILLGNFLSACWKTQNGQKHKKGLCGAKSSFYSYI